MAETETFDFPSDGWQWQVDAACAGMDTEMFYPQRGDNGKLAKQTCRGCPVRAQCLEWALEYENYGIWGGTSVLERQRIRRRRTSAA